MMPLADGGDGTLDVLTANLGGRLMATRVQGPLGKPVRAAWAILPEKIAVIEMARASGLALVRGKNRIMKATSHGTGELIRAALDRGCREIWIGVGGTATAEGGAGALEALGLRYFDSSGRRLFSTPTDLLRLARVEWKDFDVRLKRVRIRVLCDVTNPLLGPRGSARVYGPQKGANARQVRLIEQALRRWSSFARVQTRHQPGAGAAGALAFGLSAFAGARLVRGMPFIMKKLNWAQAARRADVIVTGEGKMDRTSMQGKVVGEVLRRRGRAQVWVLCGSCVFTSEQLRRFGVYRMAECGPRGLKQPSAALKQAAQKLLNEVN